jgi:hypothetical protein
MRWLIALVVAIVVVCALERFHSRAMRRAWMWNARISLSTACQDFVRTGTVPSQGNNGRIYAYTNVLTIRGTNYSCAIALDGTAFGGAGILAITTNQVFVWLDKSSEPRIIDDNYWPPFFSRRF